MSETITIKNSKIVQKVRKTGDVGGVLGIVFPDKQRKLIASEAVGHVLITDQSSKNVSITLEPCSPESVKVGDMVYVGTDQKDDLDSCVFYGIVVQSGDDKGVSSIMDDNELDYDDIDADYWGFYKVVEV